MDTRIEKIEEIINRTDVKAGKLLDFSNIFGAIEFYKELNIVQCDWQCLNEEQDWSLVNTVVLDERAIMPENSSNFKSLIKNLESVKADVIICAKNPITGHMIWELLSGEKTDFVDVRGYTKSGIEKYMFENGLVLVDEICTDIDEQEEDSENIFLAEGSLANQYFTWLDEFIHSGLACKEYIQLYRYRPEEKKTTNTEVTRPFLSVITRTQGKRIEELSEALLSLCGQECQDFEVLIMGHNLDDAQREKIMTVINDMPDYMEDKIRYIPVSGGNRSTPLNRGFEMSRGKYAVVFDDDDIVFDNWVSSFKEAAEKRPGCVVHAYVIAQDWCTVSRKEGDDILRACGAPQSQFCQDFNLLKELNGNLCPILGLAFPLFPFRNWGMRFDETLDTTEDWDFLMRISNLCGVVDVKEPTSMYRLWKNAENSHSIHSIKEWQDNRKKIQKGICERPLILTKKYIRELMLLSEKQMSLWKNTEEVTPLYFDNGHGFSEEYVLRSGNKSKVPELIYEFPGLEEMGNISSIRWDPRENGGVSVSGITVQIFLTNGEVLKRHIGNLETNGFKMKNEIVFFHPDPQIVIRFSKAININKVVISAELHESISQQKQDYLAMQYNMSLMDKGKKAVKRVGKRILKR